MDLQDEISDWESALKEELQGLKFCKQKVESDKSIPKNIKDRFIDVIRNLKLNMLQVIARCAKLNSEEFSSREMAHKVEKLRKEYETAMDNLKKLLATVDIPYNLPRYASHTYISRKREESSNKLSPTAKSIKPNPGITNTGSRTRSASVSRQETSKENIFSVLSRDLTDLRTLTRKVKDEIDSHTHTNYEERIENLEKENSTLKRQLDSLNDEHAETLKLVHNLRKRLDKLENDKQDDREILTRENRSKSRFLLKPSQDAQKYLKS